MADRHSISKARRNLPALVRKAENGQTVELTRHGKQVAVLIGGHRYGQLVAPMPSFEQLYRAFRGAVDLSEIGLDPDEVFEGVRDRTPARESTLTTEIDPRPSLADVLSALEPLDVTFPPMDDPPTEPEDLL